MIKNPIHLQILKDISELEKSLLLKRDLERLNIAFGQKYIGTNKTYHGFSTKQISDLAKKIITENNLKKDQIIELLNSLYQNNTSYTEIVIGPMILSLSSETLKDFDPKNLDLWLNYTCGWAENDVLCQSNFTSEIILNNWSNWQKILKQFNQDRNINKRRASLVLLTKSLRQSDDPRLSKLAFQNIENLKSEKEILITKAVSWLLRSLVAFHQDELLDYLEKNKDTLPKIAYREALSKALTGRKYNNSKKQKINL
ncbi:MAG: DNA alkylation repair protein [Candidatus Shapirobacteria bacterium]|nr:DNA alkylation repair protein [Candidatus Shapirobacteria bacterium]MDD4410803.1 DNA alkylation repair protein [Candidatus Shapirobacteria bacterium]